MNRLRELRRTKNLSQEELGAVLGVQKAAVCKYEKGRVALPNEMLVKLCDYFEVSADYILCRESAMVTPLFKTHTTVSEHLMPIEDSVGVPLVGRVHAGLPILADENIEEYIPVAANEAVAGEYFYMEVEGDCMEGEFIPEGALVLVRMQPNVENGRIAVVRIGEEVLLRKVKTVGDALMLIPANTKYEPMIVSRNEAEIIGRVTEIRIRNV